MPALTAEQNKALATTPVEVLLAFPMLQPEQITDPLHAYQISKRDNSLRIMAEAVRLSRRAKRVNTISPGPLARDELTGPRVAGYRRIIELCPVGRGGALDEIGNVAALFTVPEGTFINCSDFLMDGGVTASYWHWYGALAPK